MTTTKTSRHWALDAIELIGQLQALNSHHMEFINSMELNEDTVDKIVNAENMIKENNETRRELMERIAGDVGRKHRWCSAKHIIFAFELACELESANSGDKYYKEIRINLSKQMYTILSYFMDKDMTTCGRCLNDQLIATDEMTSHNDERKIEKALEIPSK